MKALSIEDKILTQRVLIPDVEAASTTPRPDAAGQRRGITRDLMTVLFLFLTLRGALFVVNYAGRTMAGPQGVPATPEGRPWEGVPTTAMGSWWEGWYRWDSGFYLTIVKDGYSYRPVDEGGSNVAFFPLYPYSIKAAIKLFGGRNHKVVGFAISNISTFFALFFILRIARRYLDEEGARRSLVYLLLFPSSFFLSAYYSEGMFLLTTAASFYYFLEGRFFLCGVWGLLAALTKNPGVLLFPSFVLSFLWNKRGKFSVDDARALWLLLIPCGLLMFMAYLYHKVGDPLASIHTQAAWHRHFTFPHLTLWQTARWVRLVPPHNLVQWMPLLELATSVVFLILPFFLIKDFDKSLAIYSLLAILMPLSTGLTVSMIRYELAGFPAFFVLAHLGENRNADRIIVAVSSLFLGLLNFGFTHEYFIV
jgi:hypothetical protein